jgi:hypothetical protein
MKKKNQRRKGARERRKKMRSLSHLKMKRKWKKRKNKRN